MIIEQNVPCIVVWDSEKKDYLSMVTLRDLLEILIFFTDSLKDAFADEANAGVSSMSEKAFMQHFLEKYLVG